MVKIERWHFLKGKRDQRRVISSKEHGTNSKCWNPIGGHFRAAFSGTGRERGEHVLIPFDLLKVDLHIQRCQNWKILLFNGKEERRAISSKEVIKKMLKSYSVSFSGREMRWPSKHSPIHTIYSISPFYWLNHYSICLKRIKRIINDIKCECIKSVFLQSVLELWSLILKMCLYLFSGKLGKPWD